MRSARALVGMIAIAALAAFGCKKDPPKPAEVDAAPGASAAAADAAPAEPKATTWKVEYTTEPSTMYIPAEKDWAHTKFKNEPSKYLGKGTFSLTVEPAGRVSGSSEGGPLGAAVLDGFYDGSTLTANVRRKDPSDEGLTGTLIGTISGDKLDGTMMLADTNAAAVRSAKLTGARSP